MLGRFTLHSQGFVLVPKLSSAKSSVGSCMSSSVTSTLSSSSNAVLTAGSSAGCPKGVTPKYSLKPLVPRLSGLLGVEVKMANDCIGEEVEKIVTQLTDEDILLMENVRFYKEEEKNDPEFEKKLASLADLYVNDAFGTAHRTNASTEGVTKYLKPSVAAGFLMQKLMGFGK